MKQGETCDEAYPERQKKKHIQNSGEIKVSITVAQTTAHTHYNHGNSMSTAKDSRSKFRVWKIVCSSNTEAYLVWRGEEFRDVGTLNASALSSDSVSASLPTLSSSDSSALHPSTSSNKEAAVRERLTLSWGSEKRWNRENLGRAAEVTAGCRAGAANIEVKKGTF
jgi:hypothetical protein